MKLWKAKKPISCVPGKSATLKNEDKLDGGNGGSAGIPLTPIVSVDRAMSPAQSEDSGLAPDRGTTYATITLPRDGALNMGITFVERNDLSYPPVIGALSPLGHAADFLAPGDRIHQIDGISTIGLSNQHVMSMLCGTCDGSTTAGNGSGTGSSGGGGGGGSGVDGGGDARSVPAVVEIEYSLPEYISQNSLCVTSKLAQITVERESGCLGLTLRGGGDFPLIVTHVRPHGPVYKTGRIKPGDRLLRVDNLSLIGKTLAEAQQIIKCGGHVSGYTNLTVEYDVSVVQSVEFSMGPLLIEIERPMNDKLGLVLCNYPATSHLDHTKIDEVSTAGIYIASIMPASIADRCGALSVGDQVLSIDDTIIENSAHSPDEVMTMLDANTGRGYTQMQIMPAHALTRRGHTTLGSPKYGFSTLESRKSRQRQRFVRKSSLPLEGGGGGGSGGGNGGGGANVGVCGGGGNSCNGGGSTGSNSGTASSASGGSSASGSSNGVNSSSSASSTGVGSSMNVGLGTSLHHPTSAIGICRSETFPVLLDCSQGSGIVLGPATACGRAVTIAQVLADSVADRSGSIQKGDRIVAINKMYNLDVQTMRQLLGENRTLQSQKSQQSPAANWLELEIEIDMADSVVPSSGVYNVKLLRAGKSGLGISVNGSSHGGFVISDVKPGSPAHRTGSLRGGDILLAVDNHPVQHYNVDSLLKESTAAIDFTTLTVKRVMLPDFLFDAQQKMPNPIYSNCAASPSEHELYSTAAYVTSKFNDCLSLKSTTPQPDFFHTTGGGGGGGGIDDNCSLQSVQMRHHQHACNTWSANTSAMGRSFAAQNTQSLTTELPDNEDNNYQDFTGYDLDRYASADCSALPPPMENKVYGSATSSSSKSSGSSLHQIIFTVRLEPKGGLLGITLAGSEDIGKPITISGLVEGGIAHKHGQIQVGDQLLAINDDSVQGMPLSHATSILQNLSDTVDLKILRAHEISSIMAGGHLDAANLPQPQAIYAKVQRRPRSPSSNTDATSASGSKDGKHRVFHVTLKKDKVYDDYGFSVSDGLYERGVFINRIRSGGPADLSGLLKPFDRIMQVNEMKTQDFDCCLTVPLIAAAGDKIELIIQRTE
ncbi:glutamate receptor-interacting protein 2 isoform X1 [Rhagoletis pomonella]|uniref:glutamate receptor-interacting protein 2 isoform X1 n=2 Tax=Rhagoletis pomonella TaxID=28610 RepID=UPI0017811F54|nr:glutamate receptor-interacting protein 2 isoform X1 [Rhagoletis pomonella]XP_036318343.1 glutamate receptor-interacting protein 2 isoform X1 [Rhagoletis pomonella]XP_036318344.1 glutamate receptor-interacting protein 2 isoform X1 [Rhagoletis pomonella]